MCLRPGSPGRADRKGTQMNRTRSIAAAGLAAVLVTAGLAASTGGAASASGCAGGPSIVGAWRMSIDPDPNPNGDPPPFASRVAFARGGVVTDTTSRFPPGYVGASGGVGAWKQCNRKATFTFERFLYDVNGFAAIQRVQGTATVSYDGKTQAGPATATLLAVDGQTVLSSFGVQASGTRMTP
jgi:hypothetical protein